MEFCIEIGFFDLLTPKEKNPVEEKSERMDENLEKKRKWECRASKELFWQDAQSVCYSNKGFVLISVV